MHYFLGIDFGTSAIKAIVIDDKSTIHAQIQHPLPAPIITPLSKGTGVEQNPQLWWNAFLNIIEQLKLQISIQDIKAIAIDGTSGTVLVTDRQGHPLANALMYNDSRTINEGMIINDLCRARGITVGNYSALARLIYFLKQPYHPKITHVLHQADWILGRLANHYRYSDSNNALKMAYDPIQNKWPDWFKELDIPAPILPTIFKPGEYIQTIDTAFTKLGFSPETCLIAGTTDSTAAIIASGAKHVGEAITSLGTTMVMKVISHHPINNETYGVYSQPYGDHWLVGGGSNSGGCVLKHFFSMQQIDRFSAHLKPDQSTGLNYYPLINKGERFPVADPEKLPQLSPRPNNDQIFFQALLEGMSEIERLAYTKLEQLGAAYPSTVISMGGGAKNKGWTDIRRKKIQRPLLTADIDQAAYGAAKLAYEGYLKKS